MQKRIIIFLLIILIAINLSSCKSNYNSFNIVYKQSNESYGDTGGLALPLDTKKTQINILVSSEIADLSDKIVVKELSLRTGLNINLISVHPSNITQKTRILISSNELPDILSASLSLNEINNLGVKGTFCAINQYLNELPNFRRTFTLNGEYKKVFNEYCAKDNNLYIFPKYDFQREVEEGFLYREDIFKKHNIPIWNSPDDFYNALKMLKQIYPDSSPYTSRLKNKVFDKWAISWGVDFPNMYFDYNKNSWFFSGTQVEFKEMLDFMRKLYKEGLIAEDFLIASEINFEAKMSEKERVFTTYDSIDIMDHIYKSVKDRLPDYDLRFAPPIGPTGQIKAINIIGTGPCITNNEKKLLSLKLLDYLLSPSGIELNSLGIKNKTYMYNSEGNVEYLGFMDNKNISTYELHQKYGMFIDEFTRSVDKRSVYFNYSEKIKEAIKFSEKQPRLQNNSPEIILNESDKEITENIKTNLINRAYEFAADYILSSNAGDEAFENWLKYAQKIGLDNLIEIYNKNTKGDY